MLLEASTESEWVACHLEALGLTVVLADPNYAPMYATRARRVKTDGFDARMPAQLLRVGLVPEAHMIGAEHRETRDLLRSRLQLVTRAVRCRHAVGSLLEKYNVPTPRSSPS